MKKTINRRAFIGAAATASAGIALRPEAILASNGRHTTQNAKPAILGGSPTLTGSFPGWPKYDHTEAKGLMDVLYSNHWGR